MVEGAAQANGGEHLVGASTEQMEHATSIGYIDRLAQLLTIDPDDGIGCDEHLASTKLHVVGVHLEPGDVEGDIPSLEVGRMRLVDVLEMHHLHRDVKAREQVAPARAVACQKKSRYHPKATLSVIQPPCALITCSTTSRAAPEPPRKGLT